MSSSCGVKVICRFRPMNQREKTEVLTNVPEWNLNFLEDTGLEITLGKTHHTFTFDRIFDSDSKQDDVYNLSARTTIDDVLEGYNGTIFAYGQSGSGKTFTMFGPDKPFPDHLKGIIPRASQHIFEHIEEDEKSSYAIKCSFLEIYKENIRDLLSPNSGGTKDYLKVRESPTRGVWVDGLTSEFATCEQDIDDLIALGDNSRSVSATLMNARSSRSHSIFIVTIEQKAEDGSTKTGKLNLVDLAGSEKISKTGATGDTLEEAKKINQSLSALGKCINALTTAKAHIPYRESKLTRILQESLGGNTKTTLIITGSPHVFNGEETISTLQFGQRAKTIKNKVTVNKQLSVAELEAALKALQKEYSGAKLYSTKLEKQLAWMKSPDYSPGKTIPPELLAEKPKPVSIEHIHETFNDVNGDENEEMMEEIVDYSNEVQPDAQEDDYGYDDPMALAEAKLTLQTLKDELEMETFLLKDEISTLQTRAQDKKAELETTKEESNQVIESLEETKKQSLLVVEQNKEEMQKITLKRQEAEQELMELQVDFTLMQDQNVEFQEMLARGDEALLILYMKNERLCTEVNDMAKKQIELKQNISELTRQEGIFKQQSQSSRLDVDMIEETLKKLLAKVHTLEEDHSKAQIQLDSSLQEQTLLLQKLKEAQEKVEILENKISQRRKQSERNKQIIEEDGEKWKQDEQKREEEIKEIERKVEEAFASQESLLKQLQASGNISPETLKKMDLLKKEIEDKRRLGLGQIAKKKEEQKEWESRVKIIQQEIEDEEKSLESLRAERSSLQSKVIDNKTADDVNKIEKDHTTQQEDAEKSGLLSSSLAETLTVKLNRTKEEHKILSTELKELKNTETQEAEREKEWKEKIQNMEAKLLLSQTSSAKLQKQLAKESARLTTNAALANQLNQTVKTQKEKISSLQNRLNSARDLDTSLRLATEKLVKRKEELTQDLEVKTRKRSEAQNKALEASRIREQIDTRRRVQRFLKENISKGSLLAAFQTKADFEAQKSGLRSTGSLLLQEAREQHLRSMSKHGENSLGATQPLPLIVTEDISPMPMKISVSQPSIPTQPQSPSQTKSKGKASVPSISLSKSTASSPSSKKSVPTLSINNGNGSQSSGNTLTVTEKSPPRPKSPRLLRNSTQLQFKDLLNNQEAIVVNGVRLTAAEIGLYEEMFKHYDSDNSGSIERDELALLLHDLGRLVTPQELDKLIKTLDKEGNGNIRFKDFLHGMDLLNEAGVVQT